MIDGSSRDDSNVSNDKAERFVLFLSSVFSFCSLRFCPSADDRIDNVLLNTYKKRLNDEGSSLNLSITKALFDE